MKNLENEEEDEVLFEGDVYLNGELNNDLILFQYPLRPNDRFYGDHGILNNVAINKPDKSSIKINYNIDPKKKNSDIHNIDNKDYNQILLGQKLDPNTNYCVGIFRNNKLYLNPLDNVMQFRHDFSNMESQDSKKKKDRIPTKKEVNNNMNQENSKETEKWEELKFYKRDSMQSIQILEKLCPDKISNYPDISLLSQDEYYKLIFKNIINEAVIEQLNEKIYLTEKILSVKELIKLALPEQIETLFKKASILSFDFILNIIGFHRENKGDTKGKKHIFDEDFSEKDKKNKKITEEEMLKLVLAYAQILKTGNFIYKSELKYDHISDLKKKALLIKQRNTMINILQNNLDKGIKKNYFSGISETVLNDILSESCEKKDGLYFLKDSIFPKNKTEEFKNNYKKYYFNEISNWETNQYDSDIKLINITDEEILKKIEENDVGSNPEPKRRKMSVSYIGLAPESEKDKGIKAPLALSRNSNSFKELSQISDYKLDKLNEDDDRKKRASSKDIKMDDLMDVDTKVDLINSRIDNNYFNNNGNKEKITQSESPLKSKDKQEEKKSNKNFKENSGKKDSVKTNEKKSVTFKQNVNPQMLKETILKYYNLETKNKRGDFIKKIFDEIPDLSNDNNSKEFINKAIDELFCEIKDNLYIRDIDEKEDKAWKLLLEIFNKGNSYKKNEIKKYMGDQEIQITDQNLNKLLRRIANYNNSSWNIKE